MGILDPAVSDAQLIQACRPGLQLTAVTAAEGHMVQAGAVLIEPVTRGIGVGMQPEQLTSTDDEHRMVKSPVLLVLVEHRLSGQEFAVPPGAALQISYSHGDVSNRRKFSHKCLPHGP